MWSQKPNRSSRKAPSLPPIITSPPKHSPANDHYYHGHHYHHQQHSTVFSSSSPTIGATRRDPQQRGGSGIHHEASSLPLGTSQDVEGFGVQGFYPEQYQHLESRVAMLEQANRNLLEELVYVKGYMIRNEELTQGAHQEVSNLKNDIRAHVSGPLDGISQRVLENRKNIELNMKSVDRVVQQMERETQDGQKELSTDIKLQTRELQAQISDLSAKVAGLRETVSDLESEKRMQEQWLKDSFAHFRDQLSWLSHNSTKSLDCFALEMERSVRNAATEHSRFANLLISTVEQESKLQTEKFDGTIHTKMEDVRKVLAEHEELCLSRNNELKMQVAAQINEQRQEATVLKLALQKDQRERKCALVVITEALALQEAECKMSREEHSAVLSAEIKTRQKELQNAELQLSKLHEVCRSSVGALREGLLSLEERVAADKKAVHLQLQQLMSEWQGVCKRMQADVTARITALHEHISLQTTSTSDDESGTARKDAKTAEGSGYLQQQQQEHWQGIVNAEVESLQKQLAHQSSSLDRLTSSLQDLQLRTVGMIHKETNQRFYSILDLKKEISNIQTRLPMLFEQMHFSNHEDHDEEEHVSPTIHNADHQEIEVAAPEPIRPQLLGEEQIIATASGDRGYSSEVERPRAVSRAPAFDYEGLISEQVPVVAYPQHYPNEDDDDDDDSSTSEEGRVQSPHEKFEQPLLPPSLFGLKREQFETSPEPHSLQSSISENFLRRPSRISQPRARLSRSQRNRLIQERYHSQNPPVLEYFDDPETQGTFTSAPATPPSQQKVLLRKLSDNQADSVQENDKESSEFFDVPDNKVDNDINGSGIRIESQTDSFQSPSVLREDTGAISGLPGAHSTLGSETQSPSVLDEDAGATFGPPEAHSTLGSETQSPSVLDEDTGATFGPPEAHSTLGSETQSHDLDKEFEDDSRIEVEVFNDSEERLVSKIPTTATPTMSRQQSEVQQDAESAIHSDETYYGEPIVNELPETSSS